MYSILETSLSAATFIDTNPEGVIHSVYRRTVNLRLWNRLLALQTEGSPVSPLSLLLPVDESGMDALAHPAGTPCRFDNRTLYIGDTAVAALTEHTEIYEDFLYAVHLSEDFYNGVRRMLEKAPRGFARLILEEELPENDLILRAAKARMDEAAKLFRKNPKEAAATLASLIGLGGGLTPSGDDFLTGLLAAIGSVAVTAEHSGKRNHTERDPRDDIAAFEGALRTAVRSRLSLTNDISAAFLEAALQGHFSKPVHALFRASQGLPGSKTEEELLDAFLAVGHSSGMDTLLGICYSENLL